MFACANLSYDEFVHVNDKALPWSRVVRLLRRGKSRRAFIDSTRKWDTTWRIMWSSLGLHWKEIPLREWWIIKIVNNISVEVKVIERLSFGISNDFYDSLVWCPYVPSLRRNFVLNTHVLIKYQDKWSIKLILRALILYLPNCDV
jgi:hypothetical protein